MEKITKKEKLLALMLITKSESNAFDFSVALIICLTKN